MLDKNKHYEVLFSNLLQKLNAVFVILNCFTCNYNMHNFKHKLTLLNINKIFNCDLSSKDREILESLVNSQIIYYIL